jgi:hypothetical protein
MPPNTRASAISATAAEKLGNDRVPDLTSDVTVKAVLSPNFLANMKAAAPLTVEWPEGYSGCRLQSLVMFLPALQRLLRDPHLPDQLRHRHPSSACFSTATICSTEKRFLFKANPLSFVG